MISAICVVAIEGNEIRRIKNYKVFLTTAAWSAFAYIWMFIVLVVITPNQVTVWEAVITFLSFPVLVVNSYMAEKNFFIKTKEKEVEEEFNLSKMCTYQQKKKYRRLLFIIFYIKIWIKMALDPVPSQFIDPDPQNTFGLRVHNPLRPLRS